MQGARPRKPIFTLGSPLVSDFVSLARHPQVVRRALKYAVIVGAILTTINHGDALLAGDFSTSRLLRIGLTVLVPYVVSTLSSVEAMKRGNRE